MVPGLEAACQKKHDVSVQNQSILTGSVSPNITLPVLTTPRPDHTYRGETK